MSEAEAIDRLNARPPGFLEPSRAGRFTATGKLLKTGKSTGFMTAELYNEAGQLTATATTTAKLVRAR